MKTLDEVIKYKLYFMGRTIDPFYAIQSYTADRGRPEYGHFYEIYRTGYDIRSQDTLTLLEDITPLMVYIFSCEEYYSQKGHGKIDPIRIELTIPLTFHDFKFFKSIKSESPENKHSISVIKERSKNKHFCVGYCTRFLERFSIKIGGTFSHFLTEAERIQLEEEQILGQERYLRNEWLIRQLDNQESDFITKPDSDEELTINDLKTFKLEQCVISLENTPNALFCNCGNICICKTCNVKKLDNCPVCKKENTVLRII